MNFREWLENEEQRNKEFKKFLYVMKKEMGEEKWKEAISMGLKITQGMNVPRIRRSTSGTWDHEYEKDYRQIIVHFDGKDYPFPFDLESAELAGDFILNRMSRLSLAKEWLIEHGKDMNFTFIDAESLAQAFYRNIGKA